MGLMNEPHDIPSISDWAGSVQAAVMAILGAGATSQMTLLPGNDYTGGTQFVSGGSGAALTAITNPDGSTDNLRTSNAPALKLIFAQLTNPKVFDVYQYLDPDSSGTHAYCVKKGISDAFQPLVTYLQSANRQALISETGGGSSDSCCLQNMCEALDFMNENSKCILGWVGWATGSFQTSYVLSLVPSRGIDVPLLTQCFAGKFGGGQRVRGEWDGYCWE
ncbi:hypothetical protein ABVK25_006212 [Lepraria finkii]|uniref:cellulase n=1 Tax=Lepraria finkii TaxID=1340010 RepID=A0ABR4B709_9LECA